MELAALLIVRNILVAAVRVEAAVATVDRYTSTGCDVVAVRIGGGEAATTK